MSTATPQSTNLSFELSDLKSCDQEPVNFIGSVQNHGCLIGFTLPDRRIQMASENIQNFLVCTHQEAISAKLEHIVDPEFADQVADAATRLDKNSFSGIDLEYMNGKEKLNAYVFHSAGIFCLELQKSLDTEVSSRLATDQVLRDCIQKIRQTETLPELGFLVCKAVRELTGMDRVMLYRFLPPNWHGEVIAEARNIQAHSFDRHRFPASDIPRTARDLYLRNGIRIIPDVNAGISKVSPSTNPKTKSMIDLSDSRLRAVSPIHLEYLRNMKVTASYSFALVVDNELWGLIACHHMAPLRIEPKNLYACEMIANTFSAQAPLFELTQNQRERIIFDHKLRKIIETVRFGHDAGNELFKNHQLVLDAFRATGLALVTPEKSDFAGLLPTGKQLKALADDIHEKMNKENKNTLAIQNVGSLGPGWDDLKSTVSGVLAFRLETENNSLLMIFRPEQLQTITWGGDPRKNLDKKGFGGRINPRLSFETWEEKIQGHSSEWLRFEIEGGQFLTQMVFETLLPTQKMLQELQRNKR